ncbi:MAG: hypothetical protein BWY13_00181 [Euryarchaeota archaeon ADurb.Bin190]|nr:MAG: hypothetical protein BWY13_00181 [Euryarchaeota archaeon ADurb.Bin190]
MVTALRVFSLGLATLRLKVEASVSARARLTAVSSTLIRILRLMVIISYPPLTLKSSR